MFKIKWEVYNVDSRRIVSRHVFRWAANYMHKTLSMDFPNSRYAVRPYKEETHGNN